MSVRAGHILGTQQAQCLCCFQSLSRVPLFVTLWHTRFLCPQLSPEVWSDSCLLSWWCYLTVSFSAAQFSFYLQSFPASGSFPVSRLFASGGQSIAVSVSASLLSMNIYGWFPLGCTGWMSLHPRGLSRVFSSPTIQKHDFFGSQPSLWFNSHIHTWLLEKTTALTTWSVVSQEMPLLFDMLSRFLKAFLPRWKCLFIFSLQPSSTVI